MKPSWKLNLTFFKIFTSNYIFGFQVFTLHSDMQTQDQKKVMKTSPAGVRKIVSFWCCHNHIFPGKQFNFIFKLTHMPKYWCDELLLDTKYGFLFQGDFTVNSDHLLTFPFRFFLLTLVRQASPSMTWSLSSTQERSKRYSHC